MKRLRKSEKGSTLIIVGGALPLLVGAAGLATDTIQWTLWKRQLQRAADSAAIAGVYQRVKEDDEDAVEGAVENDLTLNHHTGIEFFSDPEIDLLGDDGDMEDRVQVALEIQKPLPFSSLFMASAPVIRADAIAASVPGTDEYCVITLEPSASKTGITIGGSTKISMDCGMISNSPSANSALSNGAASQVTASVIAAVGGVQASANWNVDKYDPYTTAVEDPYGTVNPNAAEMSGCAANPPSFTENTVVPAGTTTLCVGSLSIGSNKTNKPMSDGATLHDVTIYVTGQNANTAGNAVIQGAFNCTTCTVVLTNKNMATSAKIGTFDMNAQATMNISSPTTGKYRGIAVFQDRRATDVNGSGSPNKFNGGGSQVIQGALYFPSQSVTYNGGGTAAAVCTRFVSRRIIFTGNSAATNTFANAAACGAYGLDAVGGGRRVRLVA